MRTFGVVAILISIALLWPAVQLYIGQSEYLASLEGPDPSTGTVELDLTRQSDWSEAVLERENLSPIGVSLSLSRADHPEDVYARETGAFEIEVIDPNGVVAFRNVVEVESLAGASRMTTGVTTVHPKASGRWQIRTRVLRADSAFEGSRLELLLDRPSLADVLSPADAVLMEAGGWFPLSGRAFLLLTGVSLLTGGFLESRRRSSGRVQR